MILSFARRTLKVPGESTQRSSDQIRQPASNGDGAHDRLDGLDLEHSLAVEQAQPFDGSPAEPGLQGAS